MSSPESVTSPRRDDGFTLIELLVTMLVIGILSAVAIPIFLSQREAAHDTAARADATALGKEISTYFVDGNTMPNVGETGDWYSVNDAVVSRRSPNVRLGGSGGTNAFDWCVYVINDQGDDSAAGIRYSATGGLETGDCTP